MSTRIEPRALTIEDVCERYSVGRTTVFAEIKAGRLRAVKLGRSTRIDARDAECWWQSARGASEPVDVDHRDLWRRVGAVIVEGRKRLGELALDAAEHRLRRAAA